MTASVPISAQLSDSAWRRGSDRVGRWFAAHRRVTLTLTLLGGLAAVFSPFLWLNIPDGATVVFLYSNEAWWVTFRVLSIVLGVAAVLSVIGDKMADGWEAKAASWTLQEGERAAEASILQLNVVLNEAIRTLNLTGRRQEDAVEALRRTIVNQAAQSVGDLTRATSYNLYWEKDGTRVLRDAEHGVVGRRDKPNKPFYERLHPDLEIWRMLDRDDDEPDVRSYPEVIEGLDWAAKKDRYLTFFSVPVKAGNVQLGMLSVNNKVVGAIGGPQRAVILAMAKTLGMATAAAKGTKLMNELVAEQDARDGLPGMSVASDTVISSEEGSTE